MRPPIGQDEAFVHQTRGRSPLARRVTEFLVRLVKRAGPISKVTPETIGEFTVGDREALLLQARRLMLGESLKSVIRCPEESCRSLLDLDLNSRDLLMAGYADAAAEHETCVDTAAGSYRVRFRLPTGADQEAAVREPSLEAGAALILRRAVREIRRDGLEVGQLPRAVADHVSARMAELDPQAELRLVLACPSCGRAFSTVLDAATFFFEELAVRAQGLFRDVHLLAFHYRWSEPSILSLPFARRRAYVSLLEEELIRRPVR